MEVEFPTEVTPGTKVSITGTAPGACQAGTAEVGWDPNPGVEGPVTGDLRSGSQVSVKVANGPFQVEIPIPASAEGGYLYASCETRVGQIGRWEEVQTTGGSGETSPTSTAPGETPSTPTEDDFAFRMNPGTSALTFGGVSSGAATPDSVADNGHDGLEFGPVLAFSAGSGVLADGFGPEAVRLPHGTRCTVSTCLWGYFAPPYYQCNQNIFYTNFGRSRYGSMTAHGYVRKGLADYIKARPLFYQDGELIKTGRWEKKDFFTPIGQTWEAWTSLRLHQQFANPMSQYQMAFQAQWYQRVSWGRDRMIASTTAVVPIPYVCTAGP